MTTFAGNDLTPALFVNNPNASDDVSVGFGGDQTFRPFLASSPMSTGAPTFNEPIAIEHVGAAPISAGRGFGPGDYIFERIHVIPNLRTIPFILSSQHVIVEVWNAYRDSMQTALTVGMSGPAGVSIESGGLADVDFAAMESKLYDILISATGAPRADNSVIFTFDGIDAPFFYASGLRLLPFTISPDWDGGVEETVGYMTDIMAAYDTTEQRMQLREIPSRSIKFTAMALDARESSLMMALLYAWQGRSYGVLLWQLAHKLGFSAGAGDQDLVVDTTAMGLAVGDTVIVIYDAFNWFASTVGAFTAGTVHLDSGVDRPFDARTSYLVPVKLGRVGATVAVARPTNASGVVEITFDLEVVEAVDSAPLVSV